MYVPILKSDAIHDNLTKQDFVDFYKAIARSFPGLQRMDTTGEYLKKENDHDKIKWAMMDSLGDFLFYCSTYFMAKGYAEDTNHKTNVFFYELTHSTLGKESDKEIGIPHGADIAFVFGQPFFDESSTTENREFSRVVMKYWTDFAKYGKPTNDWPEMLNQDGSYVKNLNPDQSLEPSRHYKVCETFWKKIFFRSIVNYSIELILIY